MRKYLLPFAISVAALAWSFPAFTQDNRNGVVVVQADPQQGDAMRQGGMGGMSDRREMMGPQNDGTDGSGDDGAALCGTRARHDDAHHFRVNG